MITSQNGDLQGTTNTAKNVVLQDVNGDWTADSKLVFSRPLANNNEQGGIIAYNSDQNYVKLAWEMSSATQAINKLRVVVIREQNGTATTLQITGADAQKIVGADGAIWLRLSKSGSTYKAYYSSDGSVYRYMGSTTLNVEATKAGRASPSTAAATRPTSTSPSTTSASPAPATRSRRWPPRPRAASAARVPADARADARRPRARSGRSRPALAEGLLGHDGGQRDLDRAGREALGRRSRARRPPAIWSTERSRWRSRCRSTPTAAHTLRSAAAPNPTELLTYDRPGQQRRGDRRLQAADHRHRGAAHRRATARR